MGGTRPLRPPRNLHSCSRPSVHCGFTFSHFADAFIQSDLQLGNTSEVPLTPSLRHCSNKYKLAREGEKDKEKDEDIEKGKDLHVVQTRKQCLVSYMAF